MLLNKGFMDECNCERTKSYFFNYRRKAGSKNSDKEHNVQLECVRCLRVLVNTEVRM